MRRAASMLAGVSAAFSSEVPVEFFEATAETHEEAIANYNLAKSRAAWARDTQSHSGTD